MLFLDIITLSCYFRVHRAGSQPKMRLGEGDFIQRWSIVLRPKIGATGQHANEKSVVFNFFSGWNATDWHGFAQLHNFPFRTWIATLTSFTLTSLICYREKEESGGRLKMKTTQKKWWWQRVGDYCQGQGNKISNYKDGDDGDDGDDDNNDDAWGLNSDAQSH